MFKEPSKKQVKDVSSSTKTVAKSAASIEDNRESAVTQRKLLDAVSSSQEDTIQRVNNTGLPDHLKDGIESLSGHSMDDVKVHYNSSKPAQLNAHAYAQGSNIHLASGQEKHLPHEAWHVVQQKQGRVNTTAKANGQAINDDPALESEADVMGAKAIQTKAISRNSSGQPPVYPMSGVVQRAIDLSTLATTQHHEYYTVHGGGTKLISLATAAPPEPPSLYSRQANTSMNGTAIDIWKARSKLADKRKLNGTTPVHSLTGFGRVLTDAREIEDTVLAEIMRQIEAQVNTAGAGALGTVGMNDCKGYAMTLRALITQYGTPRGQIGSMYLHHTNPAVATFPYHGATVVAEDGTDVVTLEAHAGQDLTEPKFHIRTGGKAGFEAANHAAHPGQYQPAAAPTIPAPSVAHAQATLDMLRQAWTDVNSRSDKSAVHVHGDAPVPNPKVPLLTNRQWLTVGAVLTAAIAAFIKLRSKTG